MAIGRIVACRTDPRTDWPSRPVTREGRGASNEPDNLAPRERAVIGQLLTSILAARKLIIAGTVLLMVVLAGANVFLRSDGGTPDGDAAIVKALAVETLILEHRIAVPAGPTTTVASDAEAAQLHASADSEARAHYAGTLLLTRIEQFDAAVDLAVRGEPAVLDGGAKDIEINQVSVEPAAATVRLRATTWASIPHNGSVNTPISRDNWTFRFVKLDGRWLVVDVETDFRG